SRLGPGGGERPGAPAQDVPRGARAARGAPRRRAGLLVGARAPRGGGRDGQRAKRPGGPPVLPGLPAGRP
ncbi:unnamed protein product, partial [Prorocentrum cordatum]